jgi:Tfp pilus assembly protein PilV
LAILDLKHGLWDAERYLATQSLVTMHTFFGTFRFTHRLRRRPPRTLTRRSTIGRPHLIAHRRGGPASSQPQPGGQAGFMLIEVLISAMLVSVIAIATFTGFDAAGRVSADERAHAQATKLVQQDEERLRGLNTTELAQLGTTTQTVTEGGTVFTITSSARFVSASKETFTCEAVGGTADYIQTTSSAKWPALRSRPAVSQSSIVSTPTTAGLLVKVKNQDEEPVEGATVNVKGASLNATQITPAVGCVIFGSLTPETLKVAVSKSTWVDKGGKTPTTKESTVTAGTLATAELTIAAPGGIIAEFESNLVKPVEADTFVAAQNNIPAPTWFVGGKAGTPLTSVELTGLFPFAKLVEKVWTPEPYSVYAGDCELNNPEKVTALGEKLKPREAKVEPNAVVTVPKVEAPALNVKVYEGTKAVKGAVATSNEAKIINTECAKLAAQPNIKEVPFEHKVSVAAGALVQKYQPYAKKLEFCVVVKIGVNYYKYKSPAPFENSKKAGAVLIEVWMKEVAAGYTKSAGILTC